MTLSFVEHKDILKNVGNQNDLVLQSMTYRLLIKTHTQFKKISYFMKSVSLFWVNGLKGIVHPKMKILSVFCSLSCCSNPVRPLFIFGTQIKIFLIKSESWITPPKATIQLLLK